LGYHFSTPRASIISGLGGPALLYKLLVVDWLMAVEGKKVS
jgi:hypothetical protein